MLIKKNQSLDLIVNYFWNKNERSHGRLPSWVIDYGAGFYGVAHDVYNTALYPNDDISELGYKAGTETLVSLSIDENASNLHLEAVVLDAVDETLVCPELSGKPLKPYDWIEEGEQWELPFERGKYRPPPWIPRWLGSGLELIQSSSRRTSPSSDPFRKNDH